MNSARLRMCLAAALALFPSALPAFAQAYPKGPVRVIVPFPAGGGVDAAGRILVQRLAESFGKPFVIENRGGANGNIGTEVAAKSPSDGTTLLFTGAGFVTNPSLYKSVPYDPLRDFEPISLMALGPNVLVVHPSLPVKSVKELIALAKSEPGRIGFAGSGSGSTPHLAGELFNVMAEVQLVHVPYRGSGPAMIGLLAGDAPVMFLPAINAGGTRRGGPPARDRGNEPGAAAGDAGSADRLRRGSSGLRIQPVVRPARAGRNAARGARPAQRPGCEYHAKLGHEDPDDERRPGADRREPRTLRGPHQERDREVGEGDQRIRCEGGLKPSGDLARSAGHARLEEAE